MGTLLYSSIASLNSLLPADQQVSHSDVRPIRQQTLSKSIESNDFDAWFSQLPTPDKINVNSELLQVPRLGSRPCLPETATWRGNPRSF